MPLTIRSIKGTLLTNEELDNNFLYLEGLNTSKLNANVFTANNILSNLITVDGEGSELDADRLRGRIPTVAANVNSVVVRDGNGSIYANIVYASKITGNVSGLAEGITGILPITSGGTGSANIIGARQNLGLKAGATYNVTLNSVDSTPNSLLKVYDFGWGIDKPSATTTISDPNWTIPGNYGFNQVFGAAAGYPVEGAYDGGMLVVGAALNVGGTGSAGDIKRFAWTNSDELYFQGADSITAGVPSFGPWREVWHSGNSNVRAMKNSIDNKVDLQDYEPEDVLTKVKTANSAITLGSTKLGLGNTYPSILGMDTLSANVFTVLTPPSNPSHAVSVSYLDTTLNQRIPFGSKGQTLMVSDNNSNNLVADYSVRMGQYIETDVELNAAKNREYDQESIFNSWYRFSHTPGSSNQPASPGELLGWQYNPSTHKFSSSINSTSYIGLISPEKYVKYVHEVQLTSTATDDDTIGVIIAWHKDPITGKESTLSAIRSPGGQSSTWRLVYNFEYQGRVTLSDKTGVVKWGNGAYGNNAGEAGYIANTVGNWVNFPLGTKIRITRDNNIITAETTDLNSSTYIPAAKITIDLLSNPILYKFMGPCPIGYSCLSQANSTFNVLNLSDVNGYIWDTRTGNGWTYENGSWVLDTDDNIWSLIGTGRILADKYTKKLYFINTDTTIQKIGVAANDFILGSTNINLGSTVKNITGLDSVVSKTVGLTQWPTDPSHATSKNYVDSIVNDASVSNQNHANNAANGAYNSAVAYTNSAIQQSSGSHSFTIPGTQSDNKDIWAIFGNGVDARTISVTIYGFVTQTNKWRLVPPGYNRVDDDVEVYTTDSRNLYFETSSRYNQYFITLRR